jgi:hypothetical protein
MDVDQQHAEQTEASNAATTTSQNLVTGSAVQNDAGNSAGNATVSSAIATLPAAEPTANQPMSASSTGGAPVIANVIGSNDAQVAALALPQTQPDPTSSSSSSNQPTSAPSTGGAPVITNTIGSSGTQVAALALPQIQPDLDLDPFADNSGLTAEELAEISLDPDAEDDDNDDANS